MSKESKNSLDAILKVHGSESIMRLGDRPHVEIPCISTGSLSLDVALGGRGFPRGRIIEVFGPESSGKTTLCLHAISEAQKLGRCALIDAEHTFDPTWARKIGVDCDELLISQPDNGEQALQIATKLIELGDISMVVIDSVAALVPKAELEGEIGDAHVGRQGKMMSQAMRIMTPKIANSGTVVVFINQIRMKIGVMFGSPETTPGGRALPFSASCRIDIRRIGGVGETDNKIGNRVRCKVVKNKIAPPFKEAEFDLLYDRGIDRCGELIDLGLHHKLIVKSGSWIKFGDVMLGQGRENARAFIFEDDVIRADLSEKLSAAMLSRL